MILTTNILLERYRDYSNPFGKIGRLVKEGVLFPLTRGIYEDNSSVSGMYLASAIYGPSYLSFNTALSYHGLIPEAVYDFTSATCEKKKKKSFTNRFGTFTYRDIPTEAFCHGVSSVNRDGYSFLIASPEKALCDKLYEMPLCRNQKMLERSLLEMRLDWSQFEEMNRKDIYFLVPKYHSSNLYLLEHYLRRKYHE